MAVLYDFLEVVGGAENLTIDLANNVQQSIIVAGINASIISKLPVIKHSCHSVATLSKLPLWKSIKAMHAFRNIDPDLLKDNVNLFSGNNAPLAIYNSAASKNYYYCHTPPRFVYDLYGYYQELLPWYQKKIVSVFADYVRSEYEPAINEMDAIFCNSKNVQARIKKYLGHDAVVIYPPVTIDKYVNKPSNGYYLSTARLEDYKRVELIVDTFIKMPDKQLVMLSGGSLLTRLQEKTQNIKNIKIVGWVKEETLIKYISECIATIYISIDEDFGMSPVESMAAGKPVIGVNEGGLKETIIHDQTGWLCDADICEESLAQAIKYMTPKYAEQMKSACKNQAEKFAPHHFHKKIKELFMDHI